MTKSNMQINFEKAKLVIKTVLDTVSNPENLQMYLVRQFYNAYHNEELDLAYDIINESFNQNLIAGYKYLECCELVGRKGEFYDIALKNPLINLN